jgi:hypothetical protein
VAGFLSSCTVMNDIQITGAPIGTKSGKAKGAKVTAQNAALNGKITKIGAVQTTWKLFVIIPVTTVKVYGE